MNIWSTQYPPTSAMTIKIDSKKEKLKKRKNIGKQFKIESQIISYENKRTANRRETINAIKIEMLRKISLCIVKHQKESGRAL
jgi:hypothetical protein